MKDYKTYLTELRTRFIILKNWCGLELAFYEIQRKVKLND